MQPAPLPNNEAQRIAALLEYEVLDTEAEPGFDQITSLASYICQTPIALVSLVDSERQWFKSHLGLTATETCRDIAFCAHVILQNQVMVVEDALNDQRFATNPLVTSDPHIRFYAGAPLINPDGYALGTLCVIDYVPRQLSLQQQEALKILAHQVMTQLELRRTVAALKEAIVERKLAEAEVRKALEKEKELSELKSRFVCMTSHEFRTPISTILASAELLEIYSNKLSEPKKIGHLHRIQGAVRKMTDLLNDVLVMGKAEAGKLHLKPTPLDLAEFCQNLVQEILSVDNHQHSITFVAQGSCSIARKGENFAPQNREFEPTNGQSLDLPSFDEKLLRQIVSNLLSNAIKYSPAGSQLDFVLNCQNGEVIFQIQDQGIGIPPEDQLHLFEPFHRATNVGNISGTGLGLAIVKKCVDLHRGKIAVNTEVGVGTKFTVTLPLYNSIPTDDQDFNN